jgi:hypothetical protein
LWGGLWLLVSIVVVAWTLHRCPKAAQRKP